MTGDESATIRQYADTHPGFPHQSTADQFFDADQFEAYRALGEHMASTVFAPVAELAEWQTVCNETHDEYKRRVRRIFATLRSEWYPLPTELRDQYIESGDVFDRLTTGLRAEPRLAGLVRRFYPELTSAITANTSSQPVLDGGADLRLQSMVPELGTFLEGLSDDATARLMVVNQIINTMEATWLSLRLDRYCAHPINRGWVNGFRRWTISPDFQEFWPILRGEYSPRFVRFCERQLNAPPVGIVPLRYNPDSTQHKDWIKCLHEELLHEWCQHAGVWPELDVPFLPIEKAFQEAK